MLQDGPWSKYQAQQAPQTAPQPQQAPDRIYGAPKSIDPADQVRLGLAQNADRRAAQDQANQNAMIGLQQRNADLEAQNKAAALSSKPFDQAGKLRDDYNQDQSVKAFQKVLPKYVAALKQADGTAAGDLALTYAYATIMDPNSAVREGEQGMVSSGDTMYGQTVARLQKELGAGGTFRPEYRQQLLLQMKRSAAEQRKIYDATRNRYAESAQRAGLNPEDVVGHDPARDYGDFELKFWAENGDQGARQELMRRQQGDPSKPVSVDRGQFAFNDQVPEEAKGYRLSPQQESEIAGAIQAKDERKALELLQQYTGYAPTDQTVGSVREAIKKGGRLSFDYTSVDDAEKAKLRAINQAVDKYSSGRSDLADQAAQGGTLGFSDEIAGLSGGLGALLAGKDPVRGYNLNRDAELQRLEDARGRTGLAGTAAEFAGGALAPIGALGKAAEAGSTLAKIGQGARSGALTGMAAGIGYGEGDNRALGGIAGAAAGGTLGSLLPVAGEIAGNRVNALRRLTGKDPSLPRQIVGEAIAADGNSPRAVGNALLAGRERGSPMSIADTGDNARQLLASVGRQPGPSRTLTVGSVVERQKAQQERIANAVVRDLGPTANIRDTSDALISKAKETAAPLYERYYSGAEAKGGASSVKLDDLMDRPSMRQAVARARRIAAEEGRDPNELGLMADEAGNLVRNAAPRAQEADVAQARQAVSSAQDTYRAARSGNGDVDKARDALMNARDTLRTAENNLKAAPQAGEASQIKGLSWQTLDYMKRGMDDYIESFRDPVTGKLNLNTEGRAANNTLRQFMARIDGVNPAYAAAREAYAGPAKLSEALNRGAKALNRSPDDLAAEVQRMSDPEKEMYRMGLRKAITDMLESKADGGDKVSALIGTPKKRAVLKKVFGDKAEYDRFIKTLQDEEAMGRTNRAVVGNSDTALRQSFDKTTADPGLAETAFDAALRGGKDGALNLVLTGIQKLREVGKFGVGEAGQRTRESVAALLTETDPEVLRELVKAAQRAQAKQRVSNRVTAQPRRVITSAFGNEAGRAVGNALAPKERTPK